MSVYDDQSPEKSEAQVDGRACWFCGVETGPMTPVAGVSTEQSEQVFQCVSDDCDRRVWPGEQR